MKEQVEGERKERAMMQVERDRLVTVWKAALQEVRALKEVVAKREREYEDLTKSTQDEIKLWKMKVKHLAYEFQTQLAQIKIDHEHVQHVTAVQHTEKYRSLLETSHQQQESFQTHHTASRAAVTGLCQKHDLDLARLQQVHHQALQSLRQEHETRLQTERDQLESRRRNDALFHEERKNFQIHRLLKSHEQSFGELKGYYHEVTSNSITLIQSLKSQLDDSKKHQDRLEKLLSDLQTENRSLHEPLALYRKQCEVLKKHASDHAHSRAWALRANRTISRLKQANQTLSFETCLLRDQSDHVMSVNHAIQAKSCEAELESQRRENKLVEVWEKRLRVEREREMVKRCGEEDQARHDRVKGGVGSGKGAAAVGGGKGSARVLESAFARIRDLEARLKSLANTHNESLRLFKLKFDEFGVPWDTMGLRPHKIRI